MPRTLKAPSNRGRIISATPMMESASGSPSARNWHWRLTSNAIARPHWTEVSRLSRLRTADPFRVPLSRTWQNSALAGGEKAAKRTKWLLELFASVAKKHYVDEITRDTLFLFIAYFADGLFDGMMRRG
jgi:hypothetical protein